MDRGGALADKWGPRSRSAALAVLVALMFFIPLVTGDTSEIGLTRLPVLYDATALPRLVLAFVCVPAIIALWAWGAQGAVRWHPTLLLLLGVAALATVSTLTSVDPAFSVLGQSERLEGMITWWLYALTFFAALQAVETIKGVRVLAAALVVSASLCAVVGLLQFVGIEPSSHIVDAPGFDLRRAHSLFGNPDLLAGLLVLALPPAVGYALAAPDRARRALGWVASFVIAGSLFVTFTRGAWLAATVAMAALIFVARRAGARFRKADAVIVGAGGGLLAALTAISLLSSGETNFLSRLAGVASSSGRDRLELAIAAVRAAIDRPLFGWGPDTFLAAFRIVRPPSYVAAFGQTASANNAHDWPLQVAATLGPLAALLFVAALVWAIGGSAKVSVAPRIGEHRFVHAALWAGCLGFLVHMVFSVAMPGSTIPFFLVLGAVCAPVARQVRAPRQLLAAAGVLFAVVSVSALVGGLQMVRADATYLRSRVVFRGLAPGDAVALASDATWQNTLSVKYARGRAEAQSEVFYELAESGDSAATKIAFSEADAAFLAVEAAHPADYPARAWHAALIATAARVFDQPSLADRAREEARAAAKLDAVGAEVSAIADGRVDIGATEAARSVPGTP